MCNPAPVLESARSPDSESRNRDPSMFLELYKNSRFKKSNCVLSQCKSKNAKIMQNTIKITPVQLRN